MPATANPTMIEGIMRAELGLANDRPIDMEPMLNLLEDTRNANFEKISRKIGPKVAKKRMRFDWRRRELMPLFCTVTVADAAGQTHIEVDNFGYIHRDALLYNTRTHELLLNNEDAAVAPNATVEIRSYTHATPGTASLVRATQVGDVINILSEAHAEGEDVPEAFRTESTETFDYIMQTDRRGSDISDIAIAEETYDPRGERQLNNKLALIEYMRHMNLLFYLSQSTREVLSASGPRRHAMAGLREKIVSNRMSFAGVGAGLTPQAIGEALRATIYQGRASSKIAMAGQYAVAAMSNWPVGSVQVSPREKEWGYNIKRILTPHGDLDVSYDPVLTATNGLADIMVILDSANVRQVFLQTMGLKIIKKVSNLSTTHRIVDAVTGTFGMQMKFEELFNWMEDIS
jgi:hypothetical protein